MQEHAKKILFENRYPHDDEISALRKIAFDLDAESIENGLRDWQTREWHLSNLQEISILSKFEKYLGRPKDNHYVVLYNTKPIGYAVIDNGWQAFDDDYDASIEFKFIAGRYEKYKCEIEEHLHRRCKEIDNSKY